MTKEQKFHFLRAIGDYLERHIKGIDLTYITDFDDGTGIIGVYWYIGDSAEVDLTSFSLDVNGQIALRLPHEEWMRLAPSLRAFICAFNHIALQTMDAISYADGLIGREGA